MKNLTIEQIIDLKSDQFFENVKGRVSTCEYKLDDATSIKFCRYPDWSTSKILVIGMQVYKEGGHFDFQRLKRRFINRLDKKAELVYHFEEEMN